MALPSNPATLANYDIAKGDQAKLFVKKVSDLFLAIAQTLTPAGLASILNGAGLLLGTALGSATVLNTNLSIKSVELGVVSTSQTVDCVGATAVAVHLASAVAVGLTLTHLALGVPVMIWYGNTSGGALNFNIAATQPGGTAYTEVFWKSSTTLTNMTTPGLSIGGGVNVISSGASVPVSPNWALVMVVN